MNFGISPTYVILGLNAKTTKGYLPLIKFWTGNRYYRNVPTVKRFQVSTVPTNKCDLIVIDESLLFFIVIIIINYY